MLKNTNEWTTMFIWVILLTVFSLVEKVINLPSNNYYKKILLKHKSINGYQYTVDTQKIRLSYKCLMKKNY